MRWAIFLAVLSLVFGADPVWAAGDDVCPLQAEFTTPGKPLEHLAAAIRQPGPIEILAVGSATMVGQDGGGGRSFPFRMAEELRGLLPGREIHLTLRGARSMPAPDMLKLMDAELAQTRFALVLWQTGAVEAAHSMNAEALRATVDAGAGSVRAAHADLVLIDLQYSRYWHTRASLDSYEEVLRDIAEAPDVALFRRYDLMRQWAENGGIDLERTRKAEQEKAVDTLHACLGDALARFVAEGAGIPGR
jgi:hypothetical protein